MDKLKKFYAWYRQSILFNISILFFIIIVLTLLMDKIFMPLYISLGDETEMPDVIEMPYRPDIAGSGPAGEKAYTCRIGGPSCLAGDVAGEYSFDTSLKVGDRLVFKDMAIYSMVKTNTFNGICLPDINLCREPDGRVETVRTFGYSDFYNRL